MDILEEKRSVIEKLMLTVLQFNRYCLLENQSSYTDHQNDSSSADGDANLSNDNDNDEKEEKEDFPEYDTPYLDAVRMKLFNLITLFETYLSSSIRGVGRDCVGGLNKAEQLSQLNKKIDSFRRRHRDVFCPTLVPAAMRDKYAKLLVNKFVRLDEDLLDSVFIHSNLTLKNTLCNFLNKVILNRFDFESPGFDLADETEKEGAAAVSESADEPNAAENFYNFAKQYCLTTIKFKTYYRNRPRDDEATDIGRRLEKVGAKTNVVGGVSIYRPEYLAMLNSIRNGKAFDSHPGDEAEYRKCLNLMERYRTLVLAMQNGTDERDFICPEEFFAVNVNWRFFIRDCYWKYVHKSWSFMMEFIEMVGREGKR